MPNEKRARHKAARQAKMAELRRAQQRRRNMKRGGVAGIAVLIALVLALATSGFFDSSHKKKVTTQTKETTTTTVAPATTTTIPASVSPKSLSAIEADLIARTPPATAASCANPSTGTSSTPTTTVPAKGQAVAIIPAPAGVGFPKLDGSAPHYTKFTAAPPFCINVKDTYTATMKTTAGTITIQLLPKYAPQTVNNFVFLAGYHYFDGIVFHRVIPGFVDQGGDPLGTGEGGPNYTIADENPKSIGAYDAGALAMANTGAAHTGGSQFFIVDGAGGASLGKPTYAMFGQITGGLSVANKINAGGGTVADSGVPPKILYKMISVTISVTPPGATGSAVSTTTTTAGATTTTAGATTTTAPATTTTSS